MLELALTMQLAMQCAPNIAPDTMAAIVQVESSRNPYAIGVVGDALPQQPTSKAEALAMVEALEHQGKNFSMGLAQINRQHLASSGLTPSDLFEPCPNLRMAGQILESCYRNALSSGVSEPQATLRAALSCYYSGNFIRGFQPDTPGDPSYVEKVMAAAGITGSRAVVPAIQPIPAAITLPPQVVDSVLAALEGAIQNAPEMADAQDDAPSPVRLRRAPETAPVSASPGRQTEAAAVVF